MPRRSDKQLSDPPSDELSDSRLTKASEKPTKNSRFLRGFGDILRRQKRGTTKYDRVEFDHEGLFAAAEDDYSGDEEDLTSGSGALNEDLLPRATVFSTAQQHHPAINLRFFTLHQHLQEDEGLDQEEGAAHSGFSPRVPLTGTSLHIDNHAASHNPLHRAFRDALPERLENAEEYRQSPRDDHFGTTHFSPASFRPTHSFGIIDIESLKERFSAIARKKEDKYQYAVIDPLPSYVHDEPFNPLRAGQRSDPIIGHVVKTGGDNPLIHLRNNSIELPQNNFEKKYKETYKKFQQEATTLLLQQLSIDVTAKNPNVILVAEINQAMISCDKGKLLEKILTAINKQNPPIMVMFNFPSSVKVDKATQKLLDQHEKRIQGLLHPHRLPTRGTRESSIRKRK